MEPKSLIMVQGKVMVYLSFYLALEVEVEVETSITEVKGTQVVEVAVVAEPLLCTLTLKKLMMLIQAATY